MSKKINVNPGHSKVAGRERQGEDIPVDQQKQAFAQSQKATGGRGPGKTAPPARKTAKKKK